jgi:hypothetical protein
MLRKAAQEESEEPGVLGQIVNMEAMARQPRGILYQR